MQCSRQLSRRLLLRFAITAPATLAGCGLVSERVTRNYSGRIEMTHDRAVQILQHYATHASRLFMYAGPNGIVTRRGNVQYSEVATIRKSGVLESRSDVTIRLLDKDGAVLDSYAFWGPIHNPPGMGDAPDPTFVSVNTRQAVVEFVSALIVLCPGAV